MQISHLISIIIIIIIYYLIYELLFVTTGTDTQNNNKHATGSQFGERICVARQVLWHCDYQVGLFIHLLTVYVNVSSNVSIMIIIDCTGSTRCTWSHWRTWGPSAPDWTGRPCSVCTVQHIPVSLEHFLN